jgi:hypothetical protein
MDVETAATWVEYAIASSDPVTRSLWRSGVTDPLVQAAVLTIAARRLDERADRAAHAAVAAGESLGAVARARQISRSASHRRYR